MKLHNLSILIRYPTRALIYNNFVGQDMSDKVFRVTFATNIFSIGKMVEDVIREGVNEAL